MDNAGMLIKERREGIDMTVERLADKAGVSKGTISQIENGKPIAKTAFSTVMAISKILGLDANELIDLSSVRAEIKTATSNIRSIPILKLEDIVSRKAPHTNNKQGREMPTISVQGELADTLSLNGYALSVTDSSMLPEFRAGDQVVIDPDETYQPGDVVVAHLDGAESAILRKYRQRSSDASGEVFELVPLNDDYPTRVVDSSAPGKVLGVVVRHLRDPRRK